MLSPREEAGAEPTRQDRRLGVWVKARIWSLITNLPFDCDLELPRLARGRDGLELSEPFAWEAASSETRLKTLNRLWDGCQS